MNEWFYNRYDVHDFSAEIDTICQFLSTKNYLPIMIKEEDVLKSLHLIKATKADTPDKKCMVEYLDCVSINS